MIFNYFQSMYDQKKKKKTMKKNYYMQKLDRNVDISKFNSKFIWYCMVQVTNYGSQLCSYGVMENELLTHNKGSIIKLLKYENPIKNFYNIAIYLKIC